MRVWSAPRRGHHPPFQPFSTEIRFRRHVKLFPCGSKERRFSIAHPSLSFHEFDCSLDGLRSIAYGSRVCRRWEMLDSLSRELGNANSSWIIRAANRRIVATCDHRIGLSCTSDKVEYAKGTRRSSRVSLRGRKLKAWLRFVVALTLVSRGKSSEGSFRGGKLPGRSGRTGEEGWPLQENEPP